MAETVVVASPSPELLAHAEGMLEVAQSYRIDCVELREAAAEDLKRVKTLAKDLDTQRRDITRPLDLAKSRVMELFRRPTEYLERAERAIKKACLAWDDEQERIRREAHAEATRKADEERKRLEAAAAEQRQRGNVET